MSDDDRVWFFPNGDLNALGSEISRSELPPGAYEIAQHIMGDGRTLPGYIAKA